MKNLMIASIVALGFAAPAVAQSQLEQSVGAEPGQFSLGELAQLVKAATESGTDALVLINGEVIDMSAGTVSKTRR